jgi:hypothetical protein
MTTETVRDSAGSSAANRTDSRRWWILGVVGLAQVMVILGTTVVNIALPSAQRALNFSNGDNGPRERRRVLGRRRGARRGADRLWANRVRAKAAAGPRRRSGAGLSLVARGVQASAVIYLSDGTHQPR